MPAIPPYLRHEPSVDPIPLVLDSPHSGEFYPDDFDHAPPRALVRQAEDTHVARLYRSAPGLGAALIEACVILMGCSAASALAEGEASLQQEDAIGNQKSISLSRIAMPPSPSKASGRNTRRNAVFSPVSGSIRSL